MTSKNLKISKKHLFTAPSKGNEKFEKRGHKNSIIAENDFKNIIRSQKITSLDQNIFLKFNLQYFRQQPASLHNPKRSRRE